jgi:hypothetical protein
MLLLWIVHATVNTLKSLTTLVVTASFAGTILYVFGYSYGCECNIYRYFEVADYLREAVIWMTPVALYSASGVVLNWVLNRVERGRTEEELIASSRSPRFTRGFRAIGDAIPPLLVITLSSVFLAKWYWGDVEFYVAAGPISFGGAILWWLAGEWYFRAPRLSVNWSLTGRFLALGFPAFMIFSFFHGLNSGGNDIRDTTNIARIVVQINDNEIRSYSGKVLFTLSRFTVISQRDSKGVVVIPSARLIEVVSDNNANNWMPEW